jgi:hypothetical protein
VARSELSVAPSSHHLDNVQYGNIIAEIDRMVEKGGEYLFPTSDRPDRGRVFCAAVPFPRKTFTGASPLEVSPTDWETRIFLFGPGLLPDSDLYREPVIVDDAPKVNVEAISGKSAAEQPEDAAEQPEDKESNFPDTQRLDASLSSPSGLQRPERSGEYTQVAANEHELARPSMQQANSESFEKDHEHYEPSVCLGTDLLTGSEATRRTLSRIVVR